MTPLLRRKIKWGGYGHFLPVKWVSMSTTTALIIRRFIKKKKKKSIKAEKKPPEFFQT